MDITTLDFQQARIKHVLFKSRLRSVLYGVRDADPDMFSIRQNPLGEWLYAVLMPRFGSFPETLELERQLQGMLAKGQELATQHQRGRLEEARSGLEQLNVFATRIEDLLHQLEAITSTPD